MNGFAEHGLDAANFDEKGAGVLGGGLRTFDAFRTKENPPCYFRDPSSPSPTFHHHHHQCQHQY
jgi:hypothetical protein